jgi:hypothetical protein
MRKLKAALSGKTKEQRESDAGNEFRQGWPPQQYAQPPQQRLATGSQFGGNYSPASWAPAGAATAWGPAHPVAPPTLWYGPPAPAPTQGPLGSQLLVAHNPPRPLDPTTYGTPPGLALGMVPMPAPGMVYANPPPWLPPGAPVPAAPVVATMPWHLPSPEARMQAAARIVGEPDAPFDAIAALAVAGPDAARSGSVATLSVATPGQELQKIEFDKLVNQMVLDGTRLSASCRWCEKCKTGMLLPSIYHLGRGVCPRLTISFLPGIRYGDESFICTQCKYWLCCLCSDAHTAVHQGQRIPTRLLEWTDKSHDFFEECECQGCSRDARSRIECQHSLCGYALCLACFHRPSALEKFLADHAVLHAEKKQTLHADIMLQAIYPEDWHVTDRWRDESCSCLDPGRAPAVTHCERCHLA